MLIIHKVYEMIIGIAEVKYWRFLIHKDHTEGSTMKSLIKVSVLAVALALTAGCANTVMQDEMVDLQNRVSTLETSGNSANSAAAAAQSTADAAARSAKQSQDCCDATNEKIDRMFQQSKSK
jgi:hypothetical protein